MKRFNLFSIAILVAAGLVVAAAPARAADVTLPAGSYPFYTLAANANDGGVDDNVYEVDGTLTLSTGAIIHCNDNAVDQPPGPVSNNASACPINILVTGDLVMETGSAIQAENLVSGGNGGNITITVGGNVLLKGNDAVNPGALISSRKISGAGDTGDAGNILIQAGETTCTVLQNKGDVTVELGAQVLADGPGNAGDITILSGRFITIDGKVSAATGSAVGRGGRITLIACCDLRIGTTGIVSSRGRDPGADLVHLEACTVVILGLVESTGAGHNDAGTVDPNACNDANHVAPAGKVFRGCVEVWAGGTVLIDASGLNNGQVNVDMAFSGGSEGMGWIDVYANGDITVTGNNVAPFALHGNAGVTNARGGVVTIKSKGGNVAASGLAVQVDATNGGGSGGNVVVSAANAVNLGTSSFFARGDFNETGGYGKGGTETMTAHTGALTWLLGGVGDVRPTGTDNAGTVLPPANRGIILLFGCPLPAPTASFPNNGAPATTPTNALCPGGAPTIPDPANTALVARFNCLANNCTRQLPPPPSFCEKAPVREVLDPVNGRFPLNQGPDKTVRVDLGESIQAELDLAAIPGYDASHNNDGYIIIAVLAHADKSLGGHTTQSADIIGNYEWPFALFGCSVTMHDPTPGDGNAAGHIAAGATAPPPPGVLEGIFIMDLHGADSSGKAGWFVEGNNRYVRNTYGSTSGTGVWIKGNNNVVHNGNANGNTGVGLKVEGNGNFAGDTDAFSNGSHGVQVLGNGNQIVKVDAGDKGKGNGGDGLNLSGTGNLIDEVDAFANKGWGFVVTGAANTLDTNTAGDKADKANGKGGFLLSGGGSLLQNTAIGNLGGALLPKVGDGFKLLTSGFSLKNNASGGTATGTPNTGCQYNFVVAGNLDTTGNKSKGAAMNGAGSPKTYAAGCK